MENINETKQSMTSFWTDIFVDLFEESVVESKEIVEKVIKFNGVKGTFSHEFELRIGYSFVGDCFFLHGTGAIRFDGSFKTMKSHPMHDYDELYIAA